MGKGQSFFFFNKSWQESRIRTCRKQSWALSSCTPAETLTPRRLQTGAESNTIKLSEGNTGDRPCGTGVGNELAKAEAPQGKARCAGLAGEHPQWQKTVTSHAFHELLDPPVSTLRGRRQSQVVHLIRHWEILKKELLQPQKHTDQLKKWAKNWNKHFSRKIYKWPVRTWKNTPRH